MAKKLIRCKWAEKDSLMGLYHDKEWGVPIHDDIKLFEFLLLDSFQAGLSWSTILKKRINFKGAFDNFDFFVIANYSDFDIKRLLNNSQIIRNYAKIMATKINAQKFLEIQRQYGSFNKYIWKFVNGKSVKNKFKTLSEIPSQSKESNTMSEDLKRKGFKFVGATICYAFMQAAGLVNDHVVGCFRYNEV
ncbi:DNA-3-methyladenine glycosylase [Candidatus Curtissbacteria bacterium RIFCSPHIGHO2_12_FULL_38_9b]|uniref:DNA-3-methyladenine glycosylase n=2 Tax=Candidatus Curtissiibacteriota TaxID=1752717 RepID=A0A1F5GVW1_9BACT|nr:MAG: DNA-3-methyladenine glycosylase [Candidatus Curtissbacteria bacterium RIFCSPLOWO2_01_FULL_37_9]OGD95969.1 MAG: DNA-3-methyladenine glycosylase [Candidatus Curtissbacteria bacterium RIFCSPHIGHO2_12_FULL_38_9b]